jgi:ribosomal protein S6
MCLLDNREVRNGWQTLKDSVLAHFTKHGAKILSGRRWDERRLAYPMKGQNRGTYLLVYFSADTQSLTAIRRDLQFREAVLRSMLLDCVEVPQDAYEPEADFDVNAIPADDAPQSDEPMVPVPAVVDEAPAEGAADATETTSTEATS